MSRRIPHELRDEFPEALPVIERLTKTDHEFRRLAESYDDVNREIYQMESGDAHTPEEVVVEARKRRLLIKDQIAAMLVKAGSASAGRG